MDNLWAKGRHRNCSLTGIGAFLDGLPLAAMCGLLIFWYVWLRLTPRNQDEELRLRIRSGVLSAVAGLLVTIISCEIFSIVERRGSPGPVITGIVGWLYIAASVCGLLTFSVVRHMLAPEHQRKKLGVELGRAVVSIVVATLGSIAGLAIFY